MIAIEEITEETIRQWTDTREDKRQAAYNRLAVEKRREEYESKERDFNIVQRRYKQLARGLRGDGMPAKQIAEWLGVSLATVYNWLKADIEIAITGGYGK